MRTSGAQRTYLNARPMQRQADGNDVSAARRAAVGAVRTCAYFLTLPWGRPSTMLKYSLAIKIWSVAAIAAQ
jgi:hypothetical protein